MKNLFHKYGKIQSELNNALNPQGIGLGLVISKILAEELSPENNKKFQIISEIGKGTTFIFYIMDTMKDIIKSNLKEDHSLNLSPKSKFSIPKDDNSMNDNENIELKNKNFEILDNPEIQLFKTNMFTDSEKKVNNGLYSSSNELSMIRRMGGMHGSNTIILFPVVKCICPKILVVDDDMFNVICLQEILKNMGFESDYAANGSEALAKLKERNEKKCCEDCKEFKLIFIDSEMPVLNGTETTKIIKQCSFLENVKIIGCSADHATDKFRIAGCDGVLAKPIQQKELAIILNDYKSFLEK